MIWGRFCCLQKRPECANKTTDAPERITEEGRYGPAAGTRLQNPAASCQAVWRRARTILGPGPTTIHYFVCPWSSFLLYTLVHSLPFGRGAI